MTTSDKVRKLCEKQNISLAEYAKKITAKIAKTEMEFEKYRVVQDRLFMSDFDKYMIELEKAIEQ